MLNEEQRDFLLPYAYNAALRAGAAILEIYATEQDYDVAIKTDSTPITIADMKAHEIIKECLLKSHVPLLSEEGREMLYAERRGWDLFWMVDPLDGTREFIKGNGEFTINIALMQDNVPVLSVVYVPYIKRIFFADRLTGSFVKDDIEADPEATVTANDIFSGATRLNSSEQPNSPIRIALSRSHNNDETYRFVDIIRLKFPDAEVFEQGSSYKFCLVAEGKADCYIRTSNTYEWDTAAGELILELAGGRTISLPDMERLEYNKISLMNPYFICLGKSIPSI